MTDAYAEYLMRNKQEQISECSSIMDRRTFLKGLGILASMPMMSKLKFLNTPAAKEGIMAASDKGIEFYEAGNWKSYA